MSDILVYIALLVLPLVGVAVLPWRREAPRTRPVPVGEDLGYDDPDTLIPPSRR